MSICAKRNWMKGGLGSAIRSKGESGANRWPRWWLHQAAASIGCGVEEVIDSAEGVSNSDTAPSFASSFSRSSASR